MDWTAIVVAAISGGVISTIITCIAQRRKVSAEAEAIEDDSQVRVVQGLIDTANSLISAMQSRVDVVNKRLDSLEAELRGRDMRIAELDQENARLKIEVEKLQSERDKQIRLNREQGDRIHELILDNQRLTERIRSLEEKLRQLTEVDSDDA